MKDSQSRLEHQEKLAEYVQIALENGLSGLVQQITNQIMLQERSVFLEADPYERTEDRRGHSNGFKNLNLKLPIGLIPVDIPQVRGSSEPFKPKVIEYISRSENAFRSVIAEMYVQGVSTRKVSAIIEKIWPNGVSSSTVSNMTKALDQELHNFRSRELTKKYKFLWVDALFEKVRIDGVIQSMAVLIAVGLNEDGKREIIGISAKISEAETHWREFFESLLKRGLNGLELIISDSHSGLQAARKAVFPTVFWQRCIFHLSQNAQSKVSKISQRKEIAFDMKIIFSQENAELALKKAKEISEKWAKSAPKFAEWVEEAVAESCTYFKFEQNLWAKIRTSNPIERLNKEIRRRTKVAGIFPNEESCLRLISAVLMEINDNWAEKTYIKNVQN